MKLKNWAGNYEYSTSNVHYPETVEQVQAFVAQHKKLRVIGTRHSFNGIADSTENLLSLERLEPVIHIDYAHQKVTISANVTYGQLSRILHRERFALHNLGSLPHISVVGACATATHGSGDKNQNLAAAVCGLELVTADGALLALSREDEVFDGAVVHLGGLGVVVRLSLNLLPTFQVKQVVYQKLPVSQLESQFDEIMSSAYSVSLFTDWQHDHINQVWVKQIHREGEPTEPQPDFFGAAPATSQLHPIATLSGDQCTPQLGIPGAWNERLPHFRFDSTPSAGNELQTEYFVPRSCAIDALRAVRSLGREIAPHLFISEIRCVSADSLWMSPCYHQDTIAIHFTWKPNWSGVKPLLPRLEAQLAPFGVRPHWGKLFTMSPQYPKLAEFRQLLQHYDPQGKFRNTFLDMIL